MDAGDNITVNLISRIALEYIEEYKSFVPHYGMEEWRTILYHDKML